MYYATDTLIRFSKLAYRLVYDGKKRILYTFKEYLKLADIVDSLARPVLPILKQGFEYSNSSQDLRIDAGHGGLAEKLGWRFSASKVSVSLYWVYKGLRSWRTPIEYEMLLFAWTTAPISLQGKRVLSWQWDTYPQ